MKTPPAMFGIPGLFSKLLILHVGFWSILGERPCQVKVFISRHWKYATVGESFKMECPVTYCAQRPNVTWCKYSGKNCLPLEIGPQQCTGWEDKDHGSIFTLHFEPVHPSDDGSYACSVDFNSDVINSNIITLNVTERTQNSSEHHLIMPPTVTLLPGENRTAVCEAIAGKPAVQIFWTPDGNHITKQESHSNGTVTVRSTYHWEQKNVSAVFCFVSHLTGNQILSIDLNQVTGVTSTLHSLLIILCVKLALLGTILLILGFVFFLKRNYFRK